MSSEVVHRDEYENPTTKVSSIDFSSLLVRTIESIRDDPAELRNAIYELARIKLQREAWRRDPPLSLLEARRLMLELETAIERVETLASQQDDLQLLAPSSPPLLPPNVPSLKLFPEPPVVINDAPRTVPAEDEAAATQFHPKRTGLAGKQRIPNWIVAAAEPVMRGSALAIVTLLSLVLLAREFGLTPPRVPVAPIAPPASEQVQPVKPATAVPARPTSPFGIPLPDVYGVYAVSTGEFRELTALPGRVPDQKVFMSTAITAPSSTTLPDGRVSFLIYRRDVASNAPERVQIRVIAKIMRAMTFDAGRANTASVADQWTIRGNSYDMRVSPVPDNAEMLMVRPENSDFVLPPGRYGLVVKGQAYDFSVPGAVTDPAQCLERVEAVNGSFYAECRKP